jgi:hypothetical protein
MASGGSVLWILAGDLIAVTAAITATFLLLAAADRSWLSARRARK